MPRKFDITIRGDKQLKIDLNRLSDGNYRRAVRRGMNSSLEMAQTTVKAKAKIEYDHPTPYTVGAFRIRYASTANLEGKLYFQDPERLSESQHYLVPTVWGVKRGNKKFEAALYARGILPRDYYTVPGKTTQLDQYGNVPASLIVEILSYFEAFPEIAGYKINSTSATRAKKAKGTKKTFGYEFFAVKVQKGRMRPGIYRRVFLGDETKIYPVLLFINKNNQWYTRSFPFYDIAMGVILSRFKDIFDTQLDKIMSEAISETIP